MIRNLLYSLLIHVLLFLAIYSGFKFKKIREVEVNEISVDVISLNDGVNQVIPKLDEEIKKEEPPREEIEPVKVKKEVKKPTEPVSQHKKKLPQIKKDEPKKTDAPEKTLDDLVDKIIDKTSKEEPEKVTPTEQEEQKFYINGAANEVEKNLELAGLSIREKLNLQSQIKSCYRRAMQRSDLKSSVTLFITISVSETGYVETNINDVIDQNLYNNPHDQNYKIAVDNARMAIEMCNPLRNLPRDKYKIWQQITFEFKGN